MSSVYKTAFERARERRAKSNVEVASPEKETIVDRIGLADENVCPDSLKGDLQISCYCKLQPLQYLKHGGGYVHSYQLCPPKGYIENWHRCPLR